MVRKVLISYGGDGEVIIMTPIARLPKMENNA
jgi:hypothetical protein